jgi:CDP-diglyceride synthetase
MAKWYKTPFWQRTLTALVLVAVVIDAWLLGERGFQALMVLVCALMIREWVRLPTPRNWRWSALAVPYCVVPCLIMAFLPQDKILLLLLVITLTDTGAYLIGKTLGRIKLAPAISPNKTIEGALGGLALGTLGGVLYGEPVWLPLTISVLAQLSDLLQSVIKRHFHVKDTGTLLPGHGGILDRVDSYVLPLWLMGLVFF